MENHPIPQDITGFQFKLIGSMTVKQFCYLAAGVVIAWFVFFILPLHLLIRLPLAVIFLGLGISLAFVPVDGRPMDTMVANLIKAIFAPTQYIYKRKGDLTSQILTQAQTQTKTQPLVSLPQQTIAIQTPPPASTGSVAAANPSAGSGLSAASQSPIAPPGKVVELAGSSTRPVLSGNLDDLVNEKKLEKEVSTLTEQLDEAKALESTETNTTNLSSAHQKTAELDKLLAETLRQKETLEKELITLKSRLEGQQQEKFNPAMALPLKQTQRVRKVPPGMEKSVGLPSASQDPNIITGIVKDPRGNPLPNILVEVKDPDDNPVRAFKTNGLGQFASATTLSNGRYIVSFEDPGEQHKFDAVEIDVVGVPIMPLEIISVDPREELRRELFN